MLFLILVSTSVIAQNETNNWYFGDYAGLDFSNGTVNALNNSGMSTPAGCSTISDRNGDLLFYTNGQTIWNRNHEVMNNGTDLAAEINNTQTSIIIPKPNNENVYYVFTTKVFPTTSSPFLSAGVYYSEIEFSTSNPLGSVTVKNIKLTPSSSEKITATHDWANNSIKVIAFGSTSDNPDAPKDTFLIFNVTENGVQQDPITSIQDEILSPGAMKISPNGKYLAVADLTGNFIYLYNFNVSTNNISLNTIINPNLFHPIVLLNPLSVYGIEFSQDSEIVYFCGQDFFNYGRLYKYIINSLNLFNDKISIDVTDEYSFGSLQLGRNGKLYIATYVENNPLIGFNDISVVNQPINAYDYLDYVPLSINLESGNSFKGLPNFISSFLRNRIITENTCENEAFNFSLDTFAQANSVLWDFGDGSTSTALNPSHQFNSPGNYIVSVDITINSYSTTLYKEIEVYPLPIMNSNQTMSQCDLDNDGISIFNLYNIESKVTNPKQNYEYFFFRSENDALNNQNFIENPELFENTSNPQEIYVKIVSEFGCETIRNFFVETTYTTLGKISNMYACENSDDILGDNQGLFGFRDKEDEIRNLFNLPENSILTFYPSIQDAQTLTNVIDRYYTTSSTTVWVRVESSNSDCFGIESIDLVVNSGLTLDIEDNYTLCKKEIQPSILLDGNINNDNWQWKNSSGNIISTDRELLITTPGIYTLTVSKTYNSGDCIASKTFEVKESGVPTINEINISDQQVQISITGESSYEYSIDNILYTGEGSTHTFPHVKAGTHTIYIKDKNNCEPTITTEIALIGFPDFFTPNNDSYNDTWKIQGLSSNLYLSAEIYIYDRYGKILYSMNINTNDEGWNGLYNGDYLQSSDYWFKAIITDIDNNTTVKAGHFSLIK